LLDNEDYLNKQQERFNELMRNKKAKESIRKFDKEKKMEKARNLQRNKEAPISKYYREQAGQATSLLQAPGVGGLPAIGGTQLGFNQGSIASSQQHLSSN